LSSAGDVDAYLATLPADQRAALQKLRAQIRSVVPSAEEVISYRIPTFRHHGGLVAFHAASNHCSLHLMSPAVMEAHRNELRGFNTTKATIHFAPDRPIPAALVRKLVRARVAENEAPVAGMGPLTRRSLPSS
jgi:uncharacterized protein YdhG (YjbR/CyaY superfamily)